MLENQQKEIVRSIVVTFANSKQLRNVTKQLRNVTKQLSNVTQQLRYVTKQLRYVTKQLRNKLGFGCKLVAVLLNNSSSRL